MGYSEFVSLICLNEALMADDSIVITTSLTLPASSREPTCAKAAADGNLEALKWLRKIGMPWDEKTSSAAAAHGHLKVLK